MAIDASAYQRRLPHYQSFNKTYLVTFVTVGRWVLPPPARDVTFSHILLEHRRKAWLETFVVMPDHVHIVMSPMADDAGHPYPLPGILHGIKGVSGRAVNKRLARSGPVWQHESFDHQIRRDESLREKCDYVAANPVRKGLVRVPEDYPWLWRQWLDDEQTGDGKPPA
ncbi:MAG: transposase [Thermoanaerobaculia bacterium]|nr:transposase [Thermoanaerobaculia bacterium]